MNKRFRIKVSGIVQGVFFRATASNEAKKRSLTGWVQNESDGSVLIEVQGEDTSLEGFKEWCKKGPIAATVHHIAVKELGENTNETDFVIRR